jgi:hypothetical protein
MLSPVDYQNSLGNTSIRLSKLWQIMLSNCFLEKDVGLLNEMGKSRASALE